MLTVDVLLLWHDVPMFHPRSRLLPFTPSQRTAQNHQLFSGAMGSVAFLAHFAHMHHWMTLSVAKQSSVGDCKTALVANFSSVKLSWPFFLAYDISHLKISQPATQSVRVKDACVVVVWERWVSSPCWLAPGCAAALCGVTRLWWLVLVVLLGPGACLIFSVLTFNAQYGKSYSHLGSLTAHTAPHLGVVPNSIFKLYFLTIDFV